MMHRLTASRTMRKRVDNVIARALAAGELLKVDDDHYHWDGMHAQGFDVEEVAEGEPPALLPATEERSCLTLKDVRNVVQLVLEDKLGEEAAR